MSKSILVVDDEESILDLMELSLGAEDYRVTRASSIKAAEQRLSREPFDLALVDIGLPDGDGLDLVQNIRTSRKCGIIVISGRGGVVDRVLGLEIGADDYIVKPFHLRDLLARIRAVSRRLSADTSVSVPQIVPVRTFWGYEINFTTRQVIKENGEELLLTTKEFDVLWTLVSKAPEVLSRDAIITAAFGARRVTGGRPVDVIVNRLRSRLFPDGTGRLRIRTVPGQGYQLVPGPEEAQSTGCDADISVPLHQSNGTVG